MLLFLDTEFTGLDQAKPDLISIGLVDEAGREFYAELPESHWTVQCNEWVHFNVIPHLQRGAHAQTEESIRNRLAAWIEALPDEVVIVTDFPNSDFFIQLHRLLKRKWPKNLHHWPMLFNTWSMGQEQQPMLQKMKDDYHSPNRPKHHALHDAHSLRLCMLYALMQGWQPDPQEL